MGPATASPPFLNLSPTSRSVLASTTLFFDHFTSNLGINIGRICQASLIPIRSDESYYGVDVFLLSLVECLSALLVACIPVLGPVLWPGSDRSKKATPGAQPYRPSTNKPGGGFSRIARKVKPRDPWSTEVTTTAYVGSGDGGEELPPAVLGSPGNVGGLDANGDEASKDAYAMGEKLEEGKVGKQEGSVSTEQHAAEMEKHSSTP